MSLYLESAPTAEGVVTLLEAKAHLRVEHDDDDDVILGLIRAAVAHFDGRDGVLGRALAAQTWRLRLCGFPPGECAIVLPLPPLISVASITYADPAGGLQTLDPGDYVVDGAGSFKKARILPAAGRWPATAQRGETVNILYSCGYAAAGEASTVPTPIRVAVLQLVGTWYENRESVVVDARPRELPAGPRMLVAPFRVY